MTKLQKLNKAKKESLEKWELLIYEPDVYHICSFCGFCAEWYDDALCGCCPIRQVEGEPCFETDWWGEAECRYLADYEDERLVPFYLAVMIYIHGFTVADLP